MTAGAIRTDFILSSEIMVISLNEVADEPLLSRAIILVVVAIIITIGVYGMVALIVKMDDIGLHLTAGPAPMTRKIGQLLVKAMPVVLRVLTIVGVVAMLWVGGHILLVGTDTLGWHAPYALVHHAEGAVHNGLVGWLVNTGLSAVAGAVVGAVVVVATHLIHRARGGPSAH